MVQLLQSKLMLEGKKLCQLFVYKKKYCLIHTQCLSEISKNLQKYFGYCELSRFFFISQLDQFKCNSVEFGYLKKFAFNCKKRRLLSFQ